MIKLTIAIDFDGVIHSYKPGDWQGVDVVTGGPVKGAAASIRMLAANHTIVIFSCRACCPTGVKAIKRALHKWDVPYDKVVFEKPHAHVYIDDRGYRFENWTDTLRFVLSVKE